MAETLKTEYQVVLTRVGDGAAEAAAQMQGLQQVSTRTQQTLTAQNASLNTLKTTATATGATMRSLGQVVQLAGMQSFPQLAMAAQLAQNALNGLRSSGVQLQANMVTVGAGVAGTAALVYSAVEAWRAYNAE